MTKKLYRYLQWCIVKAQWLQNEYMYKFMKLHLPANYSQWIALDLILNGEMQLFHEQVNLNCYNQTK